MNIMWYDRATRRSHELKDVMELGPKLTRASHFTPTITMTIRVHGYPISTATRRVLLCLFEQNLEFEFINVDLTKGDQKTPQYLSLQPFGKIPVLEDSDNNATLFESRAIGRYILSTGYAKQQTLLPASASPTQRAMIETWSAVEQSEFDPPASAISYEKVAKKVYGFGDADIGVIQYNREKLRNVFAVYEKRLGEQNYLAGEEFSMAVSDIYKVTVQRVEYSDLACRTFSTCP